ncbi:MAG: VOC family protein [Christensenellales bacterium]|jgi:glyoxylase I family protein
MKENISHIGHYGITVSNLERTRDFYENVLGFEYEGKLTMDDGSDILDIPAYEEVTGVPGVKFRIMNMKGYGINLEFLQYIYPEEIEIEIQPYIRGTSHLALVVKDPEKAYAELKNKGVWVSSDRAACIDRGTHKGVYANYFRDPDGFILEFVKPN